GRGAPRAPAEDAARGAWAGLRGRIERAGAPARGRRACLWKRRWAAPAAAAVVLTGIAGAALRGRNGQRPVAEIPMIRDALADCRRVMGRNFPRKADLRAVAEGLQFPVHPLDRPGAELFSTWKT